MTSIRLVDAGARRGIDSRWLSESDRLEVIAFEPDPVECESLRKKKYPFAINFFPVALGKESKSRRRLNICRFPGCSSLLEPDPESYSLFEYGSGLEVVDRIEVDVDRLDTYCKYFQPHVLKIDTQGTELDILIGAGKYLKNVLAVETEVTFFPLYKNQAIFCEVDRFMRKNGFQLRGMKRTFWRLKGKQVSPKGGQLIHADVLYINTGQIDCPPGHRILSVYNQHDLLQYLGQTEMIPQRSLALNLFSRLISKIPNTVIRKGIDQMNAVQCTDWRDPEMF